LTYRIGNDQWNTSPRTLTGKIPTIQLFNRVITDTERTAIFNAGPNAKCPVDDGLIAEWSGREYLGTEAAPTRILDTASWNFTDVMQGIYGLGKYSQGYSTTLSLDFPVSLNEFSGVELGAIIVDGKDMYVS